MDGVINCTRKLKLNQKQKDTLTLVSSDLQKIKQIIPHLDKIVVRGGFISDVLFRKEPRDIDLFYCIKNQNGELSIKCHCKKIRKKINNLGLKFIGKKYPYDLENSFEKEPRLKPIERTVSFFSYHSDWLSMFCLDEDGEIWSNKTTLSFLKKKMHEIRYEGFLPWAYYPKPTDSNNYYASLAYEFVRGINHIQRRELKIGEEFSELMDNMPFVLKKISETKKGKNLVNYIDHKFGNLNNLIKTINKLKIKNGNKIVKELKLLQT